MCNGGVDEFNPAVCVNARVAQGFNCRSLTTVVEKSIADFAFSEIIRFYVFLIAIDVVRGFDSVKEVPAIIFALFVRSRHSYFTQNPAKALQKSSHRKRKIRDTFFPPRYKNKIFSWK